MKKLGFVLFILLVLYFIFLIRQDIMGNLALKAEKERVEKKISEEQILLLELKDRLGRLKGDEMIEELARTRLGMIKKDETAYKVLFR